MRAWRAFLGEYDRVLIKWPIFQARMNISIAAAFYRLIHPIWEMYEKEYQGYLEGYSLRVEISIWSQFSAPIDILGTYRRADPIAES
jgi:hypothetical protein